MSNTNPHTAGRYAIIVALIGVFGTLSAVLLADYLARDSTIFALYFQKNSKITL